MAGRENEGPVITGRPGDLIFHRPLVRPVKKWDRRDPVYRFLFSVYLFLRDDARRGSLTYRRGHIAHSKTLNTKHCRK